jgi:hypothetical protein
MEIDHPDRDDEGRAVQLSKGKTPQWALTVVDKVWAYQIGRKPEVTWNIGNRRSDGREYTSGHCDYYNRITVNVVGNSPRWEQKMVLLHELAHAIDGCTGHGERFWKVAWTLYRIHNLPIRKCQTRESNRGASRRQRLATGRGELAAISLGIR